MDDFSYIIEKKKYVGDLYSACSKRYKLHEIPEGLEKTLNDLLQQKNVLKEKYLAEVEDLIILQELAKPPGEWLALKQAEKSMSESIELVKEINAMSDQDQKIQETIDLAADALKTMQEKLSILESKILLLEEKILKCQVNKESEKMNILLSASLKERNLLKSRLARLQDRVQNLQAITAENEEKEVTAKNLLTKLQEQLEAKSEYSGLCLQVKSDTSLELEFKTDSFLQLNEKMSDLDITSEELKLIATLNFSKQGKLVDVQLNQSIDAKDIISKSVASNNLVRLVLDLSKLWRTQTTLVSEIALLRKRHAIDWIPEKNILLLIVKERKNCVCTLKVPSTYPHSGLILLENVMGHTSGLTAEDVPPPSDTSLMSWLQHLDTFFGQSQEKLDQ
nr:golgin subfamily B member 1 isoform X2 [Biomphalaria glabrata]